MISSGISKETRQKIYRRDGWACALCGDRRGIQVHHLYKRSLGGTDSPHNLITLCTYCHFAIHGEALEGDRDYWKEFTDQEAHQYLADYYAPNWWPWMDA